MREKSSSPTPTAASIPAFFRPPHTVHLSAFIRLLLLLSFLSVDLPVVYSQIFPNSLFLLPLSCCLTPPCGSVEGGAALVMSRQECSRYRRSRKGGGASLQTSGFMKLRTGRKTEMKLIWRLCQEPDWYRAEEYQHYVAAVC